MNDSEFLAIEEAAEQRSEPGHYYLTAMYAVAEGTATPELKAEIERHCENCEPCRTRIEAFRSLLEEDENLQEYPVQGSLLEFAVKPVEPKRKPQPESVPLTEKGTLVPEDATSNSQGTGIGYRGDTGISWTNLAQSKDLRRLRELLPPRLPLLMEKAGLIDANDDQVIRKQRAKDLFDFILDEVRQLERNVRFRDGMPKWVAKFAERQGLAERFVPLPEMTPEIMEEYAVAQTLRLYQSKNDPAMDDVLNAARTSGVKSMNEIIELFNNSGHVSPEDWNTAASHLYSVVSDEYEFLAEAFVA